MIINNNSCENNEKNPVDKMKDNLFLQRKNIALRLTEEQINEADKFCEGYKTFLDASKTEREAVICAVKMAQKAGFEDCGSPRSDRGSPA